MKKMWWVFILITLIIANIVVYKINIDQEADSDINNKSGLEEAKEGLDKISATYIYALIGSVLIIVLMIVFVFIQKRFIR
jgi:ABC-type Fe3+ transport system permease subunit